MKASKSEIQSKGALNSVSGNTDSCVGSVASLFYQAMCLLCPRQSHLKQGSAYRSAWHLKHKVSLCCIPTLVECIGLLEGTFDQILYLIGT